MFTVLKTILPSAVWRDRHCMPGFSARKEIIAFMYSMAAVIASVSVPFMFMTIFASNGPAILAAGTMLIALLWSLAYILKLMSEVTGAVESMNLMATAAAMALAAFSLIEIAAALMLLSGQKWNDIKEGLMGLGAVLGAMIAVLAVMGAISRTGIGQVIILACSAAIVALGAAVLLAGAGIKIGAEGMKTLVPVLEDFGKLPLAKIVSGFDDMVKPILGLGLSGIAFGLGALGLKKGFIALSEGYDLLAGKDLSLIFEELSESIGKLDGSFVGFIGYGIALTKFAEGVLLTAAAITKLNEAGPNAVAGLLQGVDKEIKAERPQACGMALGLSFLSGFYAAVGQGSPWSTMIDAIGYAVEGMIIGVKNNVENMYDNGWNFATCFMSGLRDYWGWNSPWESMKQGIADAAAGIDEGVGLQAANLQTSGEKFAYHFGYGFEKALLRMFGGGDLNDPLTTKPIRTPLETLFVGARNALSGFTTSTGDAKSAWDNFANDVKDVGVIEALTKVVNQASAAFSGSDYSFDNALGGVEDILNEFKIILSENADSTKIFEDAMSDLGDTTEETASSAEKLSDIIRDQMDIFSEFNSKTEVTGEQMLNNMASQVSGVRQWAENLQYLSERGIDEGLLASLRELGPAGYEKVAAFVNMTDEQLSMAGQLFRESMSIPQGTATALGESWEKVGASSSSSYSDGLTSDESKEEVEEAAEDIVDTAVEAAKEESDREVPKVANLMTRDISSALKRTNKEIHAEGEDIGASVVLGYDEGLSGKGSSASSRPESINGVTEEHIHEILDTFEEKKPTVFDYVKGWTVFMLTGVSAAFSKFITSNASPVGLTLLSGLFPTGAGRNSAITTAARNQATGFVSAFNRTISSQGRLLSTYSPTIRPVLDTSSFTQDTSKFSSLIGADYSKYLSGSATMTLTPDSALVAALEGLGDNTDVVEEIKTLKGSMADMANAMSSMQVVLDSSVLVGEMVGPMDQALGSKAIRSRRERG